MCTMNQGMPYFQAISAKPGRLGRTDRQTEWFRRSSQLDNVITCSQLADVAVLLHNDSSDSLCSAGIVSNITPQITLQHPQAFTLPHLPCCSQSAVLAGS